MSDILIGRVERLEDLKAKGLKAAQRQTIGFCSEKTNKFLSVMDFRSDQSSLKAQIEGTVATHGSPKWSKYNNGI
jgi:hypothetical protein